MTTRTAPISTAAGTWRFSATQFWKMVEDGYFVDRRVELVAGEIYEMPAQGNYHAAGVAKAAKALERIFGRGYWVRSQSTLDLSPISALSPDVAVIVGDIDRYESENPTSALLVVEVSDSTLSFDRGKKAAVYAAAGIEDYWIVNLVDRVLEVYRNPRTFRGIKHRGEYQSETVLALPERIAPLALPAKRLRVRELIPGV